MTFLWDATDEQDETEPAEPPARSPLALRSRRGLLFLAFGGAGWLVLVALPLLTGTAPVGWSPYGLYIWLAVLLVAGMISTVTILFAAVRRSWGIALLSLALAAAGVAVSTRQNSPTDYIDYSYQANRAEFARLTADYRAGRLDLTADAHLPLPAGVRSLCPSGFAYASRDALFVQMWQNWRAESGTGLAYFAQPPTAGTTIPTAEGDTGRPQREVGDGWWWVA